MRVTVNDGLELVDERECRIVALPDGRPAAFWRGLAYPVCNGVINVGGPGFPPAVCRNSEPTASTLNYALRGTVDGLYVMLRGSVTEAELAASKLKGSGLSVARLGRYLGEAVPCFDADWFLRVAADPTEEVQARIAAVLGGPPAWRDERGLRERLLAAQLERALERDAEAKAALSRLEAARNEAALLDDAAAQSRAEAEAERQLREVAEAHAKQAQERIAELEAERTALRVEPAKRSDRAVANEFDVAMEVFLPRIKLLRLARHRALRILVSAGGLSGAFATRLLDARDSQLMEIRSRHIPLDRTTYLRWTEQCWSSLCAPGSHRPQMGGVNFLQSRPAAGYRLAKAAMSVHSKLRWGAGRENFCSTR
jgi:hypothetical protein